MNPRITVIRFYITMIFNYVQAHLEKVKHSYSSVVSYLFSRYCCLVDTCVGDSGGPLMAFTDSKRWELIGITSYGYSYGYSYGGRCAIEYPGVYTRIIAFVTWIQQSINKISAQSSSDIRVITFANGDRYEIRYSQISYDYISRGRLTDLHVAYAISE